MLQTIIQLAVTWIYV